MDELDRSIARLFEEAADRAADVPFLRSRARPAEDVTYAEFLDLSRRLARRLVVMGVAPGDRVAILSENRPRWCVAYAAILFAGGVVVPLDAGFAEDGVVNVLRDAGTRLAFLSDEQRARVGARLERDVPELSVLVLDDAESAPELRFSALVAPVDAHLPAPGSGDDPAAIIYTSGTTGSPKGVVLTHRNLRAEIAAVDGAVHIHDDVLLMFLPLNHVLGQLGSFVLAAAFSCRVVHVEVKRGEDLLRAVREEGVTILLAVPLLYHLIHERILDGIDALPASTRAVTRVLMRLNGALRRLGWNPGPRLFARVHEPFGTRLRYLVSGGAKLDPVAQRDFHRLGFTLGQAYGLTETSGAAVFTPVEDVVVGSAGRAARGMELRIRAPDADGIGEVLLRGPLVTPGYHRRPDATAQLIDADGWLATGDLGRLGPRGDLFLTGRIKDVIVLGSGKNVYPDELEAHYEKSPLIRELCVVGRRREGGPDRTEKLHAVVVPDFEELRRQGIQSVRIAIHDVIEKLSQPLPTWQRVLSFEVRREPLPRTPTRKLQRFLVEVGGGEIAGGEGHAEGHADGPASGPADENAAAAARAFAVEPGRTIARVLRARVGDAVPLRDSSSLELDLGLDSLNRMEVFLALEQQLGVRFSDDDAQTLFTVGDLLALARARAGGAPPAAGDEQDPWRAVLDAAGPDDVPEWLTRGRSRLLDVAFFATMVVLRLFGWIWLRFSLRGREHLPARGPFLICPNHQSYLDGLLLGAFLPGPVRRDAFAVGATVHVSGPLQRVFARMLKILPIDSDRSIRESLRTSAALLAMNRVLILFPEGRRSFDGRLQELREGAAVLARGLRVPIVPCAIRGTFEALPRTRRVPRPAKVTYTYGPPLVPRPGESAAELTARLRAALIELGAEDAG